jgi:hypothetical protein
MDIPEVNRYFGRMMSGVGTRHEFPYATEDAHPLTGRHCPHLGLTLAGPEGAREATLADLTVTGRALLLHPANDPGIAQVAARRRDRMESVEVTAIDHPGLDAALIRPDGVVAWAAPAGDDALTTLADALRTWFGEQAPG